MIVNLHCLPCGVNQKTYYLLLIVVLCGDESLIIELSLSTVL